jgi:hypothetical protein
LAISQIKIKTKKQLANGNWRLAKPKSIERLAVSFCRWLLALGFWLLAQNQNLSSQTMSGETQSAICFSGAKARVTFNYVRQRLVVP